MTDLKGLVKPLEWIECSDGTLHDPHCQYELETDGGWWRVTKGVTGGGSYVAHCDTRESAQSAAQADYEARLLAALDLAKMEALVEAAEMMVKAYREESDKVITAFYALEDALAAMKGGDT
jgi:hypothetical protein